jgi:hypothetical protein
MRGRSGAQNLDDAEPRASLEDVMAGGPTEGHFGAHNVPALLNACRTDFLTDKRWRERPRCFALGFDARVDRGVAHAIVCAVSPSPHSRRRHRTPPDR